MRYFMIQNLSKALKNTTTKSSYENDNRMVHHLWVTVKELPIGLPTDVNPREVKLKKEIQ